ncbi:MAG: efflux RND transporter periplasmic adaptor subunit [Acidobacteria bacterium]|nr:efflux RND transporter periplasmic adaptor subunit [Acidobacteriota bacterium]MBI3657392.1 efflux RND transporter periplasmic adaptor subunit [Acidobacteriota bacterium]
MSSENNDLDRDLNSLKIDRQRRREADVPSKWATRWIVAGVLFLVIMGAAVTLWRLSHRATEVAVHRVTVTRRDAADAPGIVLNAAGYIVAHHKIQLTAKVNGKIAWIGVEKGDPVEEGQVLVRLEDTEYGAQLQQAEGNLLNLLAQLQELEAGLRPEEIARAGANLEQAKADLENARISLARVRQLFRDDLAPRQDLDNAQARYDAANARVASLSKDYDLARLGPRREQIEAMRGRVQQARGEVALRRTFFEATVIRAPVAGIILERAVEKGEFVTTSFVGERGAKGYVVSIADLNDLQVELDISQDDFAKLSMGQKATVTTDAFPDRKYEGEIAEMSPEANRQKATVQVKVKVLKPDSFLRPEMNARCAFIAKEPARDKDERETSAASKIVIPATAVREAGGKKTVLIVLSGKVVERGIKSGSVSTAGVEVIEGLVGGEEIVVHPPNTLQDGDRVLAKEKQG